MDHANLVCLKVEPSKRSSQFLEWCCDFFC